MSFEKCIFTLFLLLLVILGSTLGVIFNSYTSVEARRHRRWQAIEDISLGDPVLTLWGNGRLDVFERGL